MKPINTSNTKITNCTPISSNCVVWEGSLPSCIEACYGDTVVDIIYKVADKTCTVLEQIDVSNIDLKCLANPTGFFGATGTGDLVSTLNVDTSSVGNVGSGEDDLVSYIIVGNQVSKTNDYVSFDISGTVANTANTKRIKIKLGTVTLFDTGTTGITVNSALDWGIKGEIIRTSSNTFKSNVYFTIGNSTYPASSDFVSGSASFSSAITFKCTGEGFTTSDIVKESFIIRSHSRNTAYVPLTSDNATVQTILAELITQHCILDTRVSTLENAPSSGGSTTPTHLSFGGTNYLCVANIVGSPLNSDATDNQIIDFIFKGLCTVGTTLTSEISRLESLIGTGSGTGTPSSVMVTSGCLFSGSKSIGQAWSYIDTHYCAFTAKFGTVAEVSSAIVEESVWLSDINTQLLTPLALDTISGSTTEAQMIKNLWHVVGALNDKLTSTALALSACCGFSCKKFEVTVNAINFDAAANTVDLRFGFDGSSNLPGAPYTFVDTGSSVIFTDSTGFSLASIPVDITGTLIPYTGYDITGLDFSGEIQVDVDLQFQVLDETDPLNIREFNCTKCLHTFFKSNVGCAFCHLIIGGTDLDVKITFTSGGTTQTMNITSAGTYIIPAASTIDDILIISGSMFTIASESCPTLVFPEYSTLSCYSFIIDNDFYDQNTSNYFYNIYGFMIDGQEVVSYSNEIRCDLNDVRNITPTGQGYCTDTSEITGSCEFDSLSTTAYPTYYDSLNKLRDINSNLFIYNIEKICTRIENVNDPSYNIVIVKAVSGKSIFMRLVPESTNENDTTFNPTPEIYIKGVEIPQGEDCDCCYVYDAS